MILLRSSVPRVSQLLLVLVSLQVLSAVASNATVSPSNCPGLDTCLRNVDKGDRCGLLPVPPQARLPSIPPGTFILTKLRPGVWAYDDTTYNSLMLYRAGHLVLADFPDSANSNTANGTGTIITDAILDILGDNKPRVIDMVYSHDHFDHIGAATRVYNFLKEEFPGALIRIWGTIVSKRTIKNSNTKRAVLPTVIVGRYARRIYMGDGLRVILVPIGGHSGRDLAVYVPPSRGQQGVVLHADVVFPKWAPFPNFAITEDLTDYVRAHKRLLKLRFGTFLGGHVLLGTKEDVRTSLEFVEDVIDAARESVETSSVEEFQRAGLSDFFDPEAEGFGNFWFLVVDVIRGVQTNRCARKVLEKWACRLGGLGVVVQSHCFTAVEFIVLED